MLKIKLIAAAAVVLGAFAAGWYGASVIAENRAYEQAASLQAAVDAANLRANEAAAALAAYQPVIKKEIQYVNREIIKYEPVDNCSLDDEFLRIYSQAVDVANGPTLDAAGAVQGGEAGQQ